MVLNHSDWASYYMPSFFFFSLCPNRNREDVTAEILLSITIFISEHTPGLA